MASSLFLFTSLFVLWQELLSYLRQKTGSEHRKLKHIQKERQIDIHPLDRLAGWLMPVIRHMPNRQMLERVTLQAGSPYQMTFPRYAVLKLLGAVGFGLLLSPKWIVGKIVYAMIGFLAPDLLLFAKRRARQKRILRELPFMMQKIARSASNGIPLREVLAVLADRLRGPLQEEVKRLSAHYSIEGNLSKCLPAFCDRIGLEEVDDMAFAMLQAEQSGKMRVILEKQAEILKRRESFAAHKNTKNRANFLPLATVGMVICIFLLVAVPLFLSIATNGLFK
ncbi:type II secretion system F family protein [Effusibacillus dendaii]|uniref:type II secretion system F family protein n=1 Tax=Effusibacillus dendaii TaxID=2743772 RepID=UPI001CF7D7CD|nr:type II secretion system F family protein [Effusibacillus dendaii]